MSVADDFEPIEKHPPPLGLLQSFADPTKASRAMARVKDAPNELLAFIEARLAEDEWWARNAGGRTDHTPPAAGEHWQWVTGDRDEPVKPDPVAGELLTDRHGELSSYYLASVERYPTGSVGDLPSFLIHTAEEVNTVAAGHIARHDPARVLRDIAAKRRLVDEYRRAWANQDAHPDDLASTGWLLGTIRAAKLLALAYDWHPDYRQEWAPTW